MSANSLLSNSNAVLDCALLLAVSTVTAAFSSPSLLKTLSVSSVSPLSMENWLSLEKVDPEVDALP